MHGTKILLGLKDYKVKEVGEDKERVVKVRIEAKEVNCLYCGSVRLHRHSMCKPSEVLHSWGLFPLAKVVVDLFHVIADPNKRMDEASRAGCISEEEGEDTQENIPDR